MPARKKPIEEHIRDQTYRKDRHGPKPPGLATTPPGDVDSLPLPEKPVEFSDEESAVWDHVIATTTIRIWPSHAYILARYCLWAVTFRAKRKAVMADPANAPEKLLIETGITDTKMLALEKELGLTPKAQAALPVVQSGPKKAQVETRPKTKLDRQKSPGRKG